MSHIAESLNPADKAAVDAERDANMLRFFAMQFWTPAMGALFISGVEPPDGCTSIPDVAGTALDKRLLHPSDRAYFDARRFLRDWTDVDEEDLLPGQMTPSDFIVWCQTEDIKSPWIDLLLHITHSSGDDYLRTLPAVKYDFSPSPTDAKNLDKVKRLGDDRPDDRKKSANSRSDGWKELIDSARKKTKDKTANPKNKHAIWTELLIMANELPTPPSPMLGVENHCILWVSEGEDGPTVAKQSKQSFIKRLARIHADEEKRKLPYSKR